jgi:hypothetical protein
MSKLSAAEVRSAIATGRWTNDEISEFVEAVKYARSQLGRQTIRAITLQSNVEFTSSKTGRTMRGFVKKIAQKYVTVDTGMGLWRVPANMLTVVE